MNLPSLTIKKQPCAASDASATIWLAPLFSLIFCAAALGQVAQPTATPTDTVTPSPTATPTPGPASTPQFTVTPGLPDPSVMAAYAAARTPTVTVTLNNAPATNPTTSAVATSTAAKVRATSDVSSGVQTPVSGGVASQTTLVAPAPGKTSGTFAAASAGASGQPALPAATVVLQYDVSHAGESVTVVTVSDGALWVNNTDGAPLAPTASLILAIDPTGMATFNYQAPGPGNTYQVVTRLDNVQTVIPFVVPDPAP